MAGRLDAQQARPARRSRRGGRLRKLLTIFSNPKMPSIQDYYEPWTYDYATLTDAPAQEHTPVARPKSLITGKDMKIDVVGQLGRQPRRLRGHRRQHDPMLEKIADKVKFEFEQTFMFYLPRICEHCLNPSCAASCPSGAIYKRAEDGIVLVDQDRCRGWRMCVSGCPYKKVYFNHRTGKAEKCTFCFPRIEVGLPTVCSETCVGRLRYIGLVLYDADRVLEAASIDGRARPLRGAARRCSSTRTTRRWSRAAERAGIPRDWIEAAQRSPIHALINRLQGRAAAAPGVPHDADGLVHPAAVAGRRRRPGHRRGRRGHGQPVRRDRRAADPDRVPRRAVHRRRRRAGRRGCCKKLAAMRSYMRDINMGREPDASIPAAVGMTEEEMYDMYRLLAIAKYDERYVIPPAHAEQAHALEELATECSVSRVRRRAARRSSARAPAADADRGRELPDAPGPADRRHRGRAGRQGGAGQPAQLGRQGRARAGCSRRGPTSEDDAVTPHRDAPAASALTDAQLTRRLAGRLAAARLPRRGAARPAST